MSLAIGSVSTNRSLGFARSELQHTGDRHRQHENVDGDRYSGSSHPASRNSPGVRFSTTVTWNWRGSRMMANAESTMRRTQRNNGVSCVSAAITLAFSVAALQQVPGTVEHHEHHRQADQREGQQLDHRFHGDGEDQTVLVFGRVGVARAEDRREGGKHQRHEEGDIGEKEGLRHPASIAPHRPSPRPMTRPL
jgi:hypothetical protein